MSKVLTLALLGSFLSQAVYAAPALRNCELTCVVTCYPVKPPEHGFGILEGTRRATVPGACPNRLGLDAFKKYAEPQLIKSCQDDYPEATEVHDVYCLDPDDNEIGRFNIQPRDGSDDVE